MKRIETESDEERRIAIARAAEGAEIKELELDVALGCLEKQGIELEFAVDSPEWEEIEVDSVDQKRIELKRIATALLDIGRKKQKFDNRGHAHIHLDSNHSNGMKMLKKMLKRKTMQ